MLQASGGKGFVKFPMSRRDCSPQNFIEPKRRKARFLNEFFWYYQDFVFRPTSCRPLCQWKAASPTHFLYWQEKEKSFFSAESPTMHLRLVGVGRKWEKANQTPDHGPIVAQTINSKSSAQSNSNAIRDGKKKKPLALKLTFPAWRLLRNSSPSGKCTYKNSTTCFSVKIQNFKNFHNCSLFLFVYTHNEMPTEFLICGWIQLHHILFLQQNLILSLCF